jgi:hypothetical protein
MLSFPSSEFDDVVAAVCHGSATDAEMRALNELLRRDALARDEYVMRVELHAHLASSPDLFSQAADIAAAGGRLPGSDSGARHGPFSLRPGVSQRKSTLVRVLAAAACLAFVAGGVWALWFSELAVSSGATSSAVAMLARAVGAQWSGGTAPAQAGGALEPGRLRLESGLAQVVFYSGARVVIEGPAELELVSPTEAGCFEGRLLVEVPPPAHGFRVKTAHVDVVDRGTTFGIAAARGRTEVHVFKGEVEFSAGAAAKQSLGEGQAAVVTASAPPLPMGASVEAFAPLFGLQPRSLAAEAIRYDQWRVASARLNRDPSLIVRLDFENLGGSDWTLPNAAERNLSVPDATIVGCRRAEGRWREKEALEFQSVNDRARLVLLGAFDALTLSAWVCVKGLDRKFNSLFMCDGFEPGTVHWLIRSDGVLGLTVIGAGAGDFQILPSPPVVTVDKLGTWLHLAVVLDGNAMQVVHYVNGSPVARHALKIGPPYRLGAAELGNWNARSGPAPAPFLIRNLSGSLDEFELFSRALSDVEIRELCIEGKPDV